MTKFKPSEIGVHVVFRGKGFIIVKDMGNYEMWGRAKDGNDEYAIQYCGCAYQFNRKMEPHEIAEYNIEDYTVFRGVYMS